MTITNERLAEIAAEAVAARIQDLVSDRGTMADQLSGEDSLQGLNGEEMGLVVDRYERSVRRHLGLPERLAAAELVCTIFGWTGVDYSSDRGKAVSQAWIDWSRSYGAPLPNSAWNARIAELAARRDASRDQALATLRRLDEQRAAELGADAHPDRHPFEDVVLREEDKALLYRDVAREFAGRCNCQAQGHDDPGHTLACQLANGHSDDCPPSCSGHDGPPGAREPGTVSGRACVDGAQVDAASAAEGVPGVVR